MEAYLACRQPFRGIQQRHMAAFGGIQQRHMAAFLYIFFSPKAVSRIKMLPGGKTKNRVVVLLYENDLKSAVNSKELTCHLPYITFFRK